MLAVQAKYEDGKVRWGRKPPVQGSHDLIVVFADVPASNDDVISRDDHVAWQKVQESSLAQVWDNQNDAVYDEL